MSEAFAPGDTVRVSAVNPPGHRRTPFYIRGKQGVIERVCGEFANPEELGYGFDGLPKKQQDIILAVGAELEAFGRKGAQDDDIEVAKVYEKAGAKISKLDIATVGKWRDIARDTAWKDYGAKTATAANLLKLASDVSA